MINKTCYLLLLSFNFFVYLSQEAFARLEFQRGIDRAAPSSKHLTVHKDYIDKTFKENGKYSLKKTKAFLEQLKKEQKSLSKDIAETKILEEVELYIKNPNKTTKKRKNQKWLKKEELLVTLDQYLIPKIEKLIAYITIGAAPWDCEAIAHNFIRGYVHYYVPNAHRSIFAFDVDFEHATAHIIKRFKFKQDDKNKVEAVNLQVQDENHHDIKTCLGSKKKTGHYLTRREIKKLKVCGFDLSKINPGTSALWSKRTPEEIAKQRKDYEIFYPRPDEKVYYNKMIYRGAGSPKFNVYVLRDGKKMKVKLKIGTEVNSEIVASELMKLCGLNQDHMRYEKSVKMYLGDITYEQFISEMANKTGVDLAKQFIWGHGGERGDEWVLIKDFLYEIRPTDELRTANVDFFTWDFTDRREYRSLLLLWGWLALNDTKLENFKVVMKRLKNGSLYPLYRFQDTGVSLGTQFYIEKPIDAIRFIKFYKVNSFPSSFLKKDKKGTIKIAWNDFASRKHRFNRTSWNDLKWMARLILKIDKKDIQKILTESGMPKSVADLYYIKLLMRRNDFIKAFNLEKEFKEEALPNLENFDQIDENGNQIIKKGKVVKRFFEGQNNVPQVRENWATFIPARLRDITTLLTDFTGSEAWTKISKHLKYSAHPQGATGAQGSISLENYKKDGKFLVIPLGIGVQALISREVKTSFQLMTTAGKTHQYLTLDTFKIRFYASSPFLNEAVSKIKNLNFTFDLKFIEKEYQLYRYSDTVGEAYSKNFDLVKAVFNLKNYATQNLRPMEFVKTSGNYGIDFEASISYDPVTFLISNNSNLKFKIKKILINHYGRDEHGQFIVVKEKTHRNHFEMGLKLLEINTFQAKLPLFSFGFGLGSFKMNFDSYAITKEETTREGVEDYLNKDLKTKQEKLLRQGVKNNEAFTREYHVETKGEYSNVKIGGLFLFNKEKSKVSAVTNIATNDGLDKNFYHYGRIKETSFGVTEMAIDFGKSEILTRNRKKLEIATESDLDKEDSTIFAIRITDYYRVRERNKVIALINDLNRRYSESNDLDFYRDYSIPKEEDMKSGLFRKIYAMTRVQVSGEELLKKIKSLTEEDLEEKLDKHFANLPQSELTLLRKWGLKAAKEKIIGYYKKLKKINDETQKNNIRKIKYMSKILFALKPELFGIKFLNELLNKKGIFVYGDISGILRNYSILQSLQQQQKRRFAGISWGSLDKKPPLQKFMREHRYVPFSAYIEKSVKDSEYLGDIQLGIATNLEHISDKNWMF